jgi:ubiquinone/menaquinone biosynthesis C-methylase UbiE
MASPQPDDRELPPPVVPPDLYDDTYFRHSCGGSETWRESGGAKVDGVYYGALKRAGLQAGDVVIDIGTGRGELLAVAVELGASRAIGVEYAEAAVALANETIAVHGVGDKAEVILGDARAIPLEDGVADLITLLDVVEHLASAELDRTLVEARRLLRPGGRLLVHTFPTRTIYDWTYRVQRLVWPGRRRRWPAEPRNGFELSMHVNEQTLWSLQRALRAAGFADATVELGEWVYTGMIPDDGARKLYHRLAKVPFTPVRALGVSNLWAAATR